MNTLERLEALAEAATAGPWHTRKAECCCFIAAEDRIGRAEWQYVAETYAGDIDHNGEFIVAAVNALPDLLKLARAAEAQQTCECYVAPYSCLDADAGRSWESPYGADRVCDPCRLRVALVPLLREEAP